MVILYEPFGGLSNNLFQHIHFHAFCKANNIAFINPFLEYKVKYFFKGRTRFLVNNRQLLAKLGLIKLLDFNEQSDFSVLEKEMKVRKTVYVKGWSYRNKPLTIQYREQYRQLFFGKNAAPDTQVIRSGKVNVGIHIRRGDYEHWQDGKFFYDDRVYVHAMKRMNELCGSNCHFLIFTNDKALSKKTYEENFSSIHFSSGNEAEDHYLMSCCDYLIGPPSTFTSWGSYLGNKPLYFLQEKNSMFTLENFDVCNG